MTFIIIAIGIIIVLTVVGYLSVVVVKKVNKPTIEELLNPSSDIIDFTGQENLDDFQKKALLSPYKQTLVIAGAGAGKTAILTKRIIMFAKYLKIPISNMLVMAFNKAAAGEIAGRVAEATGEKQQTLANNIKTIHAFALKVAKEGNEKLEIIANEKKLKNFIKQNLEKHRTGQDEALYRGKVINLFSGSELKEQANKHQKLSEPGKNIRCSDGTVVRSKAEKRIIEKLLKNNIRFEYEPMVGWADMYFEPDFFFPDYGVYAEYWGMMNHENEIIRGNYIKQMHWKQEQFKKHKFYLINVEPKKYERAPEPEDYLLARLKDMQAGQYVAWYENKLSRLFNSLEDQLVDLLISAMDITMAYGKKLRDLLPKADPFVRAVLSFVVPLCEELELKIDSKNMATFTRMMHLAVLKLEQDKEMAKTLRDKYKCIFVDEVQDLQPLTRKFIRLLTGKEQNLFAIGDDYQSIYSFAGSDPAFIVKFEHYFPEAKVMELKYNYRCHPNIVRVSNAVIKNNKIQRFKKVEGRFVKDQNETDRIVTILRLAENFKSKQALADYLFLKIPKDESVLFLARYNENKPPLEPYMREIRERFTGRKFDFLTIHRSKGLQSDNVIILNCTQNPDGKYCFPAKDNFHGIKDSIVKLCRGDKFNLVEEETRLFYVAVTRAKKRVFVVTTKGRESDFMGEKFLPVCFVRDDECLEPGF